MSHRKPLAEVALFWAGTTAQPTFAEFVPKLLGLTAQLEDVPIDKVREKVVCLLANPDEYHTRKSPPAEEERRQIEDLGPYTRSFFEEYESVEPVHREPIHMETLICRSSIGPAEYLSDCTRIGLSFDGAEIDVLPGDDRVYVGDGSEKTPDDLVSYASVYHLLLAQHMAAWQDLRIAEELIG